MYIQFYYYIINNNINMLILKNLVEETRLKYTGPLFIVELAFCALISPS